MQEKNTISSLEIYNEEYIFYFFLIIFFCNLLWVNIRAHIFSVSAGEVSSKGYIKSLPGAEDVNLFWQICNKYTIEKNIYMQFLK